MASKVICIVAGASISFPGPPFKPVLSVDTEGAMEQYYAHQEQADDRFEFHFQLPSDIRFLGHPIVWEMKTNAKK